MSKQSRIPFGDKRMKSRYLWKIRRIREAAVVGRVFGIDKEWMIHEETSK